MPEGKQWRLVAYDIRDEKRLRRVAQHLKGYGVRLQYSLFRCRLNDRQLERLRWELTTLTTAADRILYVGLCQHCSDHVGHEGGSETWGEEPPRFEII